MITAPPWKAERAPTPTDGEYDYGISATIDGREYVIAEVFGRVAEQVRPDARSTATLIAAAPELLGTGAELIRVIDALGESNVLADWPVVREALAPLRAAIAKATN